MVRALENMVGGQARYIFFWREASPDQICFRLHGILIC